MRNLMEKDVKENKQRLHRIKQNQTEKIKKYPSFANATHPKYKEQLFNFISDGFEIDDTLLGNLPEILTDACIVNAIIEDHFLVPFYNEL